MASAGHHYRRTLWRVRWRLDVKLVFVHADDMPEHGCSTVTGSRGAVGPSATGGEQSFASIHWGGRVAPDSRRSLRWGAADKFDDIADLRRDGYIVRNVPTAAVGSTGVAVLLGASVD
jgi:hypothetical protein